ncbi:MAG: T9SS type A sorting domain-containing protein [Saprospiraceae bacterium]
MKFKFLLFVSCLLTIQSNAQTLHNLPIDLTENGQKLTLGDFGGLNNPQFSEADLNNDGINDLVVFDKTDNHFFTFINGGTANTVDYTYAPEYIENFPAVNRWALLRDYNCDGIMDLFARPTDPIDGIRVWRGSYTNNNELTFTQVGLNPAPPYQNILTDVLFYYISSGFPAVVNVINTDIPAIDDIDNDGDLDVLAFRQTGGYMIHYENMSVEMGYGCDSLIFELRTDCWGRFLESATTNNVLLSPSVDSCFGTIYYVGGKLSDLGDTVKNINNGGVRHAGSTTLSLDLDNDGDKEVLIGDVSFSNMVMLTNKGNEDTAWAAIKDTLFPHYDLPIQMNIFPAAFYLDVNNDNKKDLLIAPNEENNSEDIFCAQLYENTANNQSPSFTYTQNDFIVGNMVDVGRGTAPAYFDYNNDSLMDVVIGSFGQFDTNNGVSNGRLYLYENIGTATEPEFSLVDDDYLGVAAFDVKGVIPTFGDIDGDMDEDLIIGLFDGTLYFFENTAGQGNVPAFANVVPNYQNIDIGTNAAPQLVDLNRDGLMDMVIGEYSGAVTYHENSGSIGNPIFSVVTMPFPNNSLGAIDVRPIGRSRGFSTPHFYDNNGDYELYVGSEFGAIFHYDSIDNNLNGMFNLVSDEFSGLRDGYNIKLAIDDINADGFPDFVIGNERGGIRFYSLDTNTVFTNQIVQPETLAISLFPNPTRDFITLSFEEVIYGKVDIQIINSIGQIIQTQTLNNVNQQERIDLNNLPKGMYFCQVQSEKGNWVQSFLVQ